MKTEETARPLDWESAEWKKPAEAGFSYCVCPRGELSPTCPGASERILRRTRCMSSNPPPSAEHSVKDALYLEDTGHVQR